MARTYSNDLFTIYTFHQGDRVLWVGQTKNLPRRLDEHQLGTKANGTDGRPHPWKRRGDARPWWRDATHVTFEHLPAGTTQAETDAYEARLIGQGTAYNVEHSTRSKSDRDRDLESARQRHQGEKALAALHKQGPRRPNKPAGRNRVAVRTAEPSTTRTHEQTSQSTDEYVKTGRAVMIAAAILMALMLWVVFLMAIS